MGKARDKNKSESASESLEAILSNLGKDSHKEYYHRTSVSMGKPLIIKSDL